MDESRLGAATGVATTCCVQDWTDVCAGLGAMVATDCICGLRGAPAFPRDAVVLICDEGACVLVDDNFFDSAFI